VEDFLQFILKNYTTPHFHERIFSVKNSFVRHATLAVALHCYKLIPDNEEWCTLQGLIDRSNITRTEMTPHGMLELRHLLDLGQFRHSLPSYAALADNSIVSKAVNVVYLTDAEAYSITHGFFFLGNFGLRSMSGLLSPSQTMHMQWVLDCLLGMYIRARNWDLVGELLISCHCLRHTNSDLYAPSWQALLDAQWPSGALPGPYFVPEKASALSGPEHDNYVFDKCYHTTLVAALAGALCEYIQ
jgi:hypothetical protein